MIIGELFIDRVLLMLHVPTDVFPLALLYIRIYLLGLPVILLYNYETAIFRSIGETKVPLLALAMSGIINVALNLLFVLGLKMAVNGVAIATVIANIISAMILFRKLIRTDDVIKLCRKDLHFDWGCFRKMMRIGLPAGIQSAVFSIANIVIQSAINSLGTMVIAASSAAANIELFAYYMFNSFSQACTTFVGQNYGAGNEKRCRKILLLCIGEDVIATAGVIIFILLAGKTLLLAFNSNPQVIALGYTRLKIVFFAYIFSMLYENMSGYLRGFGNSLIPALLAILGVCGVRIAWVGMVFSGHRTFETVLAAYPVSLATTAQLIFIAVLSHECRRGKCQHRIIH